MASTTSGYGWTARWLSVLSGAWLVGCAHMHKHQVTDIDSSVGRLQPFEIQVNETGLSVEDGAAVARAFARSERTRREIDTAESIIAMTQMGPKTGEPTFSDDWGDGLVEQVMRRCPSGRVTGVTAKRETMKYPVITGEIITVKGYCIL